MIFTNTESNVIYTNLYNWLANHTTGERYTKSYFDYYQKLVWNTILEKIKLIRKKSNLTKKEKEFLNLVLYEGTIYRLQNYNPNLKGYIYPMPFYQSWSKNIIGLQNVTGFAGKSLLIKSYADLGIDIFELLCFLLKYGYITDFEDKNPKNLIKYESENEITYPIIIENIEEIYIVNKDNINKSIKENICLPREKWIRNKLN